MTDYTKTTDFAAKDSLPSGDSGKIIKGTEFETEFDNIATAVATKSNIASPTFTGTTTIPTVDINGGAIDGTAVGVASASTGAFTTLTASTSLNIASSTTVDGVLDEDNMASDSATKLATQQSIKAYVDSQITANNELSEILVNGNTTGGTDIAVGTGDDITFADSSKAIFGAGSDLQIYHDGSNSYVSDQGAGDLYIRSSNDLWLQNAGGTETYARFDEGASTYINYAGATKLTTTSTGIDVTGNATFDDNGKAIFGDGSDLQIYHDGSNSYIAEGGTGNLQIQAQNLSLEDSTGTRFFLGIQGGETRLYNQGNQKVAVTSTGIDVTGTASADKVLVSKDGTDHIEVVDASSGQVTNLTTGNTVGYISVDSSNSVADSAFSVYVDGSQYLTVDSTGNVGIGTDSPTRLLELETTTANESYLRISGTSGNVADTNFAGIEFYNLDSSAAGPNVASFIEARAQTSTGAGGELVFATLPSTASEGARATERLRIDADGNVGIGAAAPTRKLHVNDESNSIVGRFSSGQTSTWAQFASNSTGTASRIGSPTDDAVASIAFMTRDQERLRIDEDGHVIIPEGVTLGTAAGTYNADNTLDDYEEGTFTMSLYDALGGGNQSPTQQTAYYTKIGNKVTISVSGFNNIDTTGMTAGNILYFSLPFSSSSTGRAVGSVIHHGFTYAGNSSYQDMKPYVDDSSGRARFGTVGYGTADSTVKVSDITSGDDDIHTLTLTYFA